MCTFPNCGARFSRQDNSLSHYRTHLVAPRSNLKEGESYANKTKAELDQEERDVEAGKKALDEGTAVAVVRDIVDDSGAKQGEHVERMVGLSLNARTPHFAGSRSVDPSPATSTKDLDPEVPETLSLRKRKSTETGLLQTNPPALRSRNEAAPEMLKSQQPASSSWPRLGSPYDYRTTHLPLADDAARGQYQPQPPPRFGPNFTDAPNRISPRAGGPTYALAYPLPPGRVNPRASGTPANGVPRSPASSTSSPAIGHRGSFGSMTSDLPHFGPPHSFGGASVASPKQPAIPYSSDRSTS